jgi:DNA repair protein RadC
MRALKNTAANRPQWVRVVREPNPVWTEPVRIAQPADVVKLLGAEANAELVEVFWVVLLNTQSRVLDVEAVSRGILGSSLVHPREVFATAITYRAAGIIAVHNHPSGDPTPSADDRAVTRQLVEAGKLLDIPVFDHVILAGDRYTSFAEAGLL